MLNYRVISSDAVVVSSHYRVKLVSFEVASKCFEATKLYVLKRIDKALYIARINELLNS